MGIQNDVRLSMFEPDQPDSRPNNGVPLAKYRGVGQLAFGCVSDVVENGSCKERVQAKKVLEIF